LTVDASATRQTRSEKFGQEFKVSLKSSTSHRQKHPVRSSIKDLQAPGKPGRSLPLDSGLADEISGILFEQLLVDEDIFEKVEAATNVVEAAGLSDDIPIIGLALKEFGVELATNAINYFQEALQEGYLAEYTEDVENELACQLFCACFDDCTITLERVYAVMYSNVVAEVPDDPLEWNQLLALLAGIDITTDTVVHIMFWFLWGSVKLASMMFSSINPGVTLQKLITMAVDDASPDWLILCDCGSDWSYELDSTTNPVWVTFPDWGDIGGTVVFQTTNSAPFGFDVTGINILITFPTVQDLTGIRVNALETVGVEGASVVNRFWAMLDSGDAVVASGELPIIDEPWEVFTGVDAPAVKKVIVQYLFVGSVQEMTWQPVQLFGFGVNPFL